MNARRVVEGERVVDGGPGGDGERGVKAVSAA